MNDRARRILVAMAVYWCGFGLVTILYPPLMDLFQTSAGVAAGTPFSDHVWMHGGFDILSFCVLVSAIARYVPPSAAMMRAVGLAALMPVLAITWSLVGTPYWSPLFLVAGGGCLGLSLAALAVSRSLD